MNNRYICKAKRKDNGEWVEGDLMQWSDGTIRICVDSGDDEKNEQQGTHTEYDYRGIGGVFNTDGRHML